MSHIYASCYPSKLSLKLSLAFLNSGPGKTDIVMSSDCCHTAAPGHHGNCLFLQRFPGLLCQRLCDSTHVSPGVALPCSPRVTLAEPHYDKRFLEGRIKQSEDAWLVSRLPFSIKVKASESSTQPTIKNLLVPVG